MSDLGVIIGRFQSHDLRAHIDMMRIVAERHDRVLVIIEDTPARNTRENPIDASVREHMIAAALPDAKITVVADMALSSRWSAAVDAAVAEHADEGGAIIYPVGEASTARYEGAYPLADADFVSASMLLVDADKAARASAADEMLSLGLEALSALGIGQELAANGRYPAVFTTVDVAIFDKTGTKVLLARKPNETLFRFVGGFADPTGTFEDDAKREVMEETRLSVKALAYVGSAVVDDWRYRSEADRIKTMLFRATVAAGEPVATDDIEELRWFDAARVVERAQTLIVAEHRPLVVMLEQAGHMTGGRTPLRAYAYALVGLVAVTFHDAVQGVRRRVGR